MLRIAEAQVKASSESEGQHLGDFTFSFSIDRKTPGYITTIDGRNPAPPGMVKTL